MSAINDERLKFGNKFEYDIGNVWQDVMMLLAFCEALRKDRVDSQDFMGIPENLRHKRFSLSLRYHLACTQWFDPTLSVCK